jgi:hypothetical protein
MDNNNNNHLNIDNTVDAPCPLCGGMDREGFPCCDGSGSDEPYLMAREDEAVVDKLTNGQLHPDFIRKLLSK